MAQGQQIAVPSEAPAVSAGAEPEVIGPFLAEELRSEAWLECSVAHISGGMSNLTYAVSSAAGEVIVRRPPLGAVLETAHDMAREYRVMTALGGTGVPVPRTFTVTSAGEELEFACLVMERVVGHACRERLPAGYADAPAQRARIGEALVEVLARLHTVDPAAVGLEEFGRPAGFLERQLRRWGKQWQSTRTESSPSAALERLRGRLAASLPEEERAAIVHGDYRLDNCLLHPAEPGSIAAVLDWEMSTLGDPLTDLGALLAYWAEPDDDEVLVAARVVPAVTAAEGFPSRGRLIELYGERTGFDLAELGWYLAFAYFKLAVVCQGIAARHAAGAMIGEGFEAAEGNVAPLIEAGQRALDRLEGGR